VLLVSHDTNAITTLCDRAMILEGGRVYAEGDPKQMTIAYHKLLFGEQKPAVQQAKLRKEGTEATTGEEAVLDRTAVGESAAGMRYGTGEARLVDYGILDSGGQRVELIESGKGCRIYMVLDCDRDIPDLSCGIAIKDRRGTVLWGVTNMSQTQTPYNARAGSRLTIAADCIMWLSAGDYFVTLGAAHWTDGAKLDFVEDAIGFKVIGPGGIFTTSTVNLQTQFSIECQTGWREDADG
jgi:lipopolysaccharide transport system ATP-binding protein